MPFLLPILVLADASTDLSSLPTWIWPPVAIILGLAAFVFFLNQRGILVSGREKADMLKIKDDQNAAVLKAKDEQIGFLTEELDKANERWQDERDQRIADAQAMASLKQAAQMARGAMTEVVEGLGNEPPTNPYEQRLGSTKRRPQ